MPAAVAHSRDCARLNEVLRHARNATPGPWPLEFVALCANGAADAIVSCRSAIISRAGADLIYTAIWACALDTKNADVCQMFFNLTRASRWAVECGGGMWGRSSATQVEHEFVRLAQTKLASGNG